MQGSGLTWQILAIAVALVAAANVVIFLLYRWSTKLLVHRLDGRVSKAAAPITVSVLAQEMDDLKEHLATLKAEVRHLKTLKPAISPYNQALHMAKQGYAAGEVASSCGISRGEAELIIALYRKSKINGVE